MILMKQAYADRFYILSLKISTLSYSAKEVEVTCLNKIKNGEVVKWSLKRKY